MRRFRYLTLAFVFFSAFASLAQAQSGDAAPLAERALGDPGAPVTIIAYESLSCPHCAAFHRDTFEALKARYVDTGEVRFIFREFPLNGPAVRASQVARCTSEGRFFGLVQILFRAQAQWVRSPDIDNQLARIGRFAGLSTDKLDASLADEALVNGILESRQQGEALFGVRSTPSFVIDGTLYEGNRSLEEFAAIIDPLLAGQ